MYSTESLSLVKLSPEFKNLTVDKKYHEVINRLNLRQWNDLAPKRSEKIELWKSLTGEFETQYSQTNNQKYLAIAKILQIEALVASRKEKQLDQARVKLEELSQYFKSENLGLFVQGRYHFYNGMIHAAGRSWDLATTNIQQAIDLYEDQVSLEIYPFFDRISFMFTMKGDNQKSIEYRKKALELSEHFGLKNQMMVQRKNIAFSYRRLGQYAEAMDIYQIVIAYFKQQGMVSLLIETLNEVAVLKYSLDKYDEELSYLLMAEKHLEHESIGVIQKTFILGNIYNNYINQKNFPKATLYYEKAMKIAKNNNLFADIIYLDTQLSYQKISQDLPAESITILDSMKSIDQKHWTNFDRYSYKRNYFRAYRALGDAQKAKVSFLEALKLLEGTGRDDLKENLYGLGYEFYKEIQDHSEALKYHELFSSIKEKRRNEESKKLLYIRENNFITTQNKLLEQENQLQAEEIKSARYLRIILSISIITVVFLILGIILISRSRHVIRNQKKKIEDILKNIELGIATVGSCERFDDEFSPKIQDLLNFNKDKDIKNFKVKDVLDIMKIKNDQRDQIEDIIKLCIGSEIENYLLNNHLINGEFAIDNDRILQIDWYPMVQGGIVKKLMMVVKDITETKALQEEVRKKDLNYELGVEISSQMLDNTLNMRQLFERCQNTIVQIKSESWSAEEVLAILHSLKCSARVLSLKQLALDIHNMEHAIIGLKENRNERTHLEKDLFHFEETTKFCFEIFERLKNDNVSVNVTMYGGLGKIFNSIELMLKSKSIPLTYSVTSNFNQLKQDLLTDSIDIVTHALTGVVLKKRTPIKLFHFRIAQVICNQALSAICVDYRTPQCIQT